MIIGNTQRFQNHPSVQRYSCFCWWNYRSWGRLYKRRRRIFMAVNDQSIEYGNSAALRQDICFPKKVLILSRACSLFLDRSISLDGSLQGPGRGTKRYSQDFPPYSAPLSPKLPKNDHHPLEGEQSLFSQPC